MSGTVADARAGLIVTSSIAPPHKDFKDSVGRPEGPDEPPGSPIVRTFTDNDDRLDSWSRALGRRSLPAFLTIVFLILAPCLHARGRSEDGLTRAEALIERKEYEQAINLLADVIRQDPELFDGAQLLVERIRRIQEAYNTLLAELPRVLYERG